MGTIAQLLIKLREVEEKFRNIQENPSLNGAENGLTDEENGMLEKLIVYCGEVNLAGDAIARRALGIGK